MCRSNQPDGQCVPIPSVNKVTRREDGDQARHRSEGTALVQSYERLVESVEGRVQRVRISTSVEGIWVSSSAETTLRSERRICGEYMFNVGRCWTARSMYISRMSKHWSRRGADDFEPGVAGSDKPPGCIGSRNSRRCNKVGPSG